MLWINPRQLRYVVVATTLVIMLLILFIQLMGKPRARNPSPLKTLNCSQQGSLSMAWSPDGLKFACAGDRGAIEIYDTITWRSIAYLQGHTGWITEIVWDLQGHHLASLGLTDNMVIIWDVLQARITRSIKVDGLSPRGSEVSLIWGEEGNRLAVIPARFGAIHILDVASGEVSGVFPEAESASWNSTRNILAVANGSDIQVIDVATGNVISVYSECNIDISFVSYSPDGNSLAAVCGDEIYIPTMGTRLPHPKVVGRMAWSPDGKRIAGITADRAYIWELTTSQVLNTLDIYSTSYSSLAWSLDGNRLAISGGQSVPDNSYGTLWIWDVISEEVLYELSSTTPSAPFAWNPKGDMLATEENDLVVYSIP